MSRYNRQQIDDNNAFICDQCGRAVAPIQSGGKQRNHCPHCLWSKHLDLKTGDRRSGCRGLMEPIGIWVQRQQEWALVHRCQRCGFLRTNRIAGDDNEVLLFILGAKPMAQLPFPADKALATIHSTGLKGEKL